MQRHPPMPPRKPGKLLMWSSHRMSTSSLILIPSGLLWSKNWWSRSSLSLPSFVPLMVLEMSTAWSLEKWASDKPDSSVVTQIEHLSFHANPVEIPEWSVASIFPFSWYLNSKWQMSFFPQAPGHLLTDVSLSPCRQTHLEKSILTAQCSFYRGPKNHGYHTYTSLAMAITWGVELALAFTPGDLLWGVSRSSPT